MSRAKKVIVSLMALVVLAVAYEMRPSDTTEALQQLEADARNCLDPLPSADPVANRIVCGTALLEIKNLNFEIHRHCWFGWCPPGFRSGDPPLDPELARMRSARQGQHRPPGHTRGMDAMKALLVFVPAYGSPRVPSPMRSG